MIVTYRQTNTWRRSHIWLAIVSLLKSLVLLNFFSSSNFGSYCYLNLAVVFSSFSKQSILSNEGVGARLKNQGGSWWHTIRWHDWPMLTVKRSDNSGNCFSDLLSGHVYNGKSVVYYASALIVLLSPYQTMILVCACSLIDYDLCLLLVCCVSMSYIFFCRFIWHKFSPGKLVLLQTITSECLSNRQTLRHNCAKTWDKFCSYFEDVKKIWFLIKRTWT